MIVGFFVMVAAYVFGISWVECAVLALTIVFVLVCELINTALEAFVDLLGSEWRGQAKVAKDVSAGMVLVSALGAIIVGSFIFLPPIVHWVRYYWYLPL